MHHLSKIDKLVFLQIGIGLFANLLVIYSVYQIKSVNPSIDVLGMLNCFVSSYQYKWLVEASFFLALMNAIFLFIASWWQTKMDIKKLVLLFIPVEIFLLEFVLNII